MFRSWFVARRLISGIYNLLLSFHYAPDDVNCVCDEARRAGSVTYDVRMLGTVAIFLGLAQALFIHHTCWCITLISNFLCMYCIIGAFSFILPCGRLGSTCAVTFGYWVVHEVDGEPSVGISHCSPPPSKYLPEPGSDLVMCTRSSALPSFCLPIGWDP